MTDVHDAYAITTESYRKIIEEQSLKIDLLRKVLVTCKADWVKALLETKRMRAALEDSEKRFATLKTAYDRERKKPIRLHGSAALNSEKEGE